MSTATILLLLFGALIFWSKFDTFGWTEIIIISVVLLFIIAIIVLVYFNQNKLIYMPHIPDQAKSPSENPFGFKHPGQQALPYEKIEVLTEDGIKLRGWHLKAENPQRVIVYFQQNAGNIGARIPFLRRLFQSTNSDIILVAYRGYSDSEGVPTQFGLRKDGEAIMKYAIEYKNAKNIKLFVLGRSLGGAVAIHVASKPGFKQQIAGVILQNTFTSIPDMIDSVMPAFTKLKFLCNNYWRSVEIIGQVQAPIFFIKSMKDQLVPPAHMELLMHNAKGSSLIIDYQIQNGTHNQSWSIAGDTYFLKLMDFFQHQKIN